MNTIRNIPALRANIRTLGNLDGSDIDAVRFAVARALHFGTDSEANQFIIRAGLRGFETVVVNDCIIVVSHELANAIRRIKLNAGRAFLRIMDPIWERESRGADADAGFDAGEWSHAAHARHVEVEEERVTALVAGRFGLSPGDVYAAAMHRVYAAQYAARERAPANR